MKAANTASGSVAAVLKTVKWYSQKLSATYDKVSGTSLGEDWVADAGRLRPESQFLSKSAACMAD